MNYIDPAKYSELLNKFAKDTKRGVLKEGYVDLKPVNSLSETSPTQMSHIYAKYPESMEETADIKNPGKYKPKSYDLDGDGVPNGADKAPRDGAKHEGFHLGQLTGPSGYQLENLTPDEQTQLKEYVRSIKTIKGAIQELLSKAKGMKAEGGDTTGLTMPEGE